MVNKRLLSIKKPDIKITDCLDVVSALEILDKDKSIDIILLDINMPERDGWDFLRHFSKMGMGVPVIILTSSVSSADYNKSKLFKCVINYMEKPLNPEKINHILSVH
jgi:CheY-like chemotaxis protein